MLGKLIKDECKSYRFPFGIVFLTGVIFTIFMKIICMLPYQQEAKEVIQIFSAYGYYYIVMLISVAAQVLIVIRFYSTMVGDRGYLTWTLPVSSSTHIWAKLIGGMIWQLLANIVTIVLLVIFYVGDYWLWSEDIRADFNGVTIGGLASELMDLFKPEYLIPIVLAILAMIAWSVMSFLLIYMCIAVGQLFGKWRIPASIGCYFVIMIGLQVISVIGVILISMSGVFFENANFNFNLSGVAVCSIIFGIMFLIGLGIDAILFAVTNNIFKKHLNLE